jgi:hypothetical protein
MDGLEELSLEALREAFAKKDAEIEELSLEKSLLKEALANKEAEAVFLRERLTNLRALVGELGGQMEKSGLKSAAPQRPLAPVPTGGLPLPAQSAFPGIKLRRETVIKKNPEKLAFATPPPPVEWQRSETPAKEKKKGSRFGFGKKKS